MNFNHVLRKDIKTYALYISIAKKPIIVNKSNIYIFIKTPNIDNPIRIIKNENTFKCPMYFFLTTFKFSPQLGHVEAFLETNFSQQEHGFNFFTIFSSFIYLINLNTKLKKYQLCICKFLRKHYGQL